MCWWLLLLVLLAACSSSDKPSDADLAKFDYDLIYSMPKQPLDFRREVQPVLEQRCVVCHGCYDAPCQLKFSSAAGIDRGASKELVYNGARIKAADPSRLFIDASTTEQWREKGFYSIFDPEGRDSGDPEERLQKSVMYQMLLLKQLHPQPAAGLLPKAIDTSLGRSQSCPKLDEFDKYARKFPLQGMPFAMPNLSHDEYATLVHWIAQGAPLPKDTPPSAQVQPQLERWETFLNGEGNKQQLVSRYLYEHLFQGHIHFEGSDQREFYRLVRSSTPPGEAIKVVNTRRVYDDPQGPVFYRLVRLQGSIVAKDHVVYQWSDARMRRYRQLFIEPDYEVTELPGFDPVLASNPIRTFAALPLDSRYRFLLDDAKFFIEGFIKGPVCRGQIALNVIEDQFWVVFANPDAPQAGSDAAFLDAISEYLASPSEMGDNLKLLAGRKYYGELHKKYMEARQAQSNSRQSVPIEEALSFVWDGDGNNPNAALTIFRHFDSASVSYGFHGDYPETAWVIDFPLLERIHYLLVAGYDVYGNIGVQLNSRLYMDFLRMEGEDYFLTFMPASQRETIRTGWYSGIRSGLENSEGLSSWFNQEFVTGYQTDDPQREFYQYLERYLDPLSGGVDFMNRCDDLDCPVPDVSPERLRVERAMRRAVELNGVMIQYMPEVALLRVRMGGDPADDLSYSLISNKAYKTVSSMFLTEKPGNQRDYAYDTQTVVPFIAGSYPDFFYEVDFKDIDDFAERYTTLTNRDQYEQFVARFGVRRTDSRFWAASDWFNQRYRTEKPLTAGILDLNRYQNR